MLYEELPWVGLSKHWLFDDRLVLVMRPDHPLAKRKDFASRIFSKKNGFSLRVTRGATAACGYFEQNGMTQPRTRIESRNPGRFEIDHFDQRSRRHHLAPCVERELEAGTLRPWNWIQR